VSNIVSLNYISKVMSRMLQTLSGHGVLNTLCYAVTLENSHGSMHTKSHSCTFWWDTPDQ